jgi:hypothetical protein
LHGSVGAGDDVVVAKRHRFRHLTAVLGHGASFGRLYRALTFKFSK